MTTSRTKENILSNCFNLCSLLSLIGDYGLNQICNQPVAGSSPISSSKEYKDLGVNLSPFFMPVIFNKHSEHNALIQSAYKFRILRLSLRMMNKIYVTFAIIHKPFCLVSSYFAVAVPLLPAR